MKITRSRTSVSVAKADLKLITTTTLHQKHSKIPTSGDYQVTDVGDPVKQGGASITKHYLLTDVREQVES